eukprot:CAMPEP_0168458156 /NCGR_PEP_ID=MMETSP0228-20121227/52230_1 /TAXON_ID=133427 /ORGANISM="Protoceratium reticulatum, Strain CCCM 535 (=CCMP 1889)" /LENGTH=89 /DNA_ID=CAMNT_0008473243 /DNA_START=58 /DNA_END=328 /DNA_ORIENTATION=+
MQCNRRPSQAAARDSPYKPALWSAVRTRGAYRPLASPTEMTNAGASEARRWAALVPAPAAAAAWCAPGARPGPRSAARRAPPAAASAPA